MVISSGGDGAGGTVQLTSREERKLVLGALGKRSYDLGRRFLEEAGIEGRLATRAHACLKEGLPGVIFLGDECREFRVDIVGGTRNGYAEISYQRPIFVEDSTRPTIPALVQHDDLLKLLERLCGQRDYKFRPYALINSPPFGDAVVCIYHSFLPKKFTPFAKFIRLVDEILTEYVP